MYSRAKTTSSDALVRVDDAMFYVLAIAMEKRRSLMSGQVPLGHLSSRTNALTPPPRLTGSFTHLRTDISLSQTVVTHQEYVCFTAL